MGPLPQPPPRKGRGSRYRRNTPPPLAGGGWGGGPSTLNVLFHYAAGPDLAARLVAIPNLRITICAEHDETLLTRLLTETDVLWHVLKRCTAEMIAAAPKLRLIQKIGVGVNTIDLDAAKHAVSRYATSPAPMLGR